MKAKLDLVTNQSFEAYEKARDMNLPEPELEYVKREIYFTLKEVNAAYVNNNGEIVIYHPSNENGFWVLDYDEELWDKIKEHLGLL